MRKVMDDRHAQALHRRDWPAVLRKILTAKAWREFYKIAEPN